MRLNNSGMFTGIEREGLLSGTPTLFVQGPDVAWSSIRAVLDSHGVRHLELGSGRDLRVNPEVLSSAINHPGLDYVTVETCDLAVVLPYLDNPKFYVLFPLLMRHAYGASYSGPNNPEVLSAFSASPRFQLKVDNGVHVVVLSVAGLASLNRNDIFVADTEV